jgi:uncharacterized cupredoxin-like copper-binding protein
MKERLRGSVLLALLLAITMVAAACSSGDNETSEGTAGGESPQSMAPTGSAEGETPGASSAALADFSITLGSTEFAAGEVAFAVTNNGPSEHEMVIIKTKDAPDALPTNSDGTVDEEAKGLENMGEVEEVAPGASATLTLDLAPGSYVALCNIPGHYEAGMATGFTVK